MKQTLLTVLLAVTALLAAAQDNPTTVTKTFADVADTQIRKGNSTNWGGSVSLEMNSGSDIYVLMGFEYEVPVGMKVQKATLHFVTNKKQGKDVKLYAYDNNFVENTIYADEENYVTAALSEDKIPVAIFELNGHGQKNISEVSADEFKDWQNLQKWQNSVEISEYMKTVSPATQRVNFIFVKAPKNNVCSKEAADKPGEVAAWLTDIEDKSVLKPYLEVEFVKDSDTEVANISDDKIKDTSVRENNPGFNRGESGAIETKLYGGTKIYGVMQFTLPSDVEEIQSANLRLVSSMVQGDRKVSVYGYDGSIDDEKNYVWNDQVKTHVDNAFKSTPIAQFSAKGSSYSMTDTRSVTISKCTKAEDWTNTINLTDYAKMHPTGFAILLSKDTDQNSGINFNSKEAKDTQVTPEGQETVTYAANDIKPVLTVVYKKKNNPTGIQTVEVEMENAPVEYYNLNGVKVSGDNMAPGIYVRRQGTKTTKILVK